jgi:hypothetical protein
MAKSKKPKKKSEEEEESSEGGMSLDDAFADDEDVVYAESKPKPKKDKKKKQEETEEDEEEEVEETQTNDSQEKLIIKQSKPIEQIKKGDKIIVDGKNFEVDAVIVLIDHKVTKEMAIECFDPKTDKDYQIRYFTGRLDVSDPVLYELVNDFMYVKRPSKKMEW